MEAESRLLYQSPHSINSNRSPEASRHVSVYKTTSQTFGHQPEDAEAAPLIIAAREG